MVEETPASQKLIDAYNRMLNRVRAAFERGEDDTQPTLKHGIDAAREKASELGELSREEADSIAGYLRRDISDAAEYLAETGSELADWLRFDIAQVEDRMLEAFASVADQTTVELKRLEGQARLVGEWHTGEITGIGTLYCVDCGEELHFHATGHIPPCPKCRHTVFKRAPRDT